VNAGITDDEASVLATGLISNDTLTELDLSWNSGITRWALLSRALCKSSSLFGPNSSNLTLEKLGDSLHGYELPGDLRSLLRINNEHNGPHAARLRLIKNHSRGGFCVSPFLDVQWKVLPYAIAWISGDGSNNEVNDKLFDFVRSITMLFDINGTETERRIRRMTYSASRVLIGMSDTNPLENEN